MWGNKKSHANSNILRLFRQIEAAKEESRKYGVKPLRPKSYKGTIHDELWWDYPQRASYWDRNWKRHRRTQYKCLKELPGYKDTNQRLQVPTLPLLGWRI